MRKVGKRHAATRKATFERTQVTPPLSLCRRSDPFRMKIEMQFIAKPSSVAVGTPVNPTPPAQIRTCRIAAYGSYRRCLASKRRLGCG
jgi:hypothetical protein